MTTTLITTNIPEGADSDYRYRITISFDKHGYYEVETIYAKVDADILPNPIYSAQFPVKLGDFKVAKAAYNRQVNKYLSQLV